MNKDEFFEVARQLKPDLTQEEYDVMWEEFVLLKNEHEKRKMVN